MSKKNRNNEPAWFALYTRPRAEKKVHERLQEQGFESYLPLKKVKRQWSDRVKLVEVPVISSYVFIKCSEKEREEVVKTDGVIRFIFHLGRPAVIRDDEMERMWKFLADYSRMKLEVVHFEPGQKVRVEAGPLKGKKGEVVHTKNTRASVRLEGLGMEIRVELEGALLSGDPP